MLFVVSECNRKPVFSTMWKNEKARQNDFQTWVMFVYELSGKLVVVPHHITKLFREKFRQIVRNLFILLPVQSLLHLKSFCPYHTSRIRESTSMTLPVRVSFTDKQQRAIWPLTGCIQRHTVSCIFMYRIFSAP